jgi:hypothetical protein
VNQQGWTALAALQAGGNEIVARTRTHSDLANLDVMTIKYTGSATAASITINSSSNRFRTFLNGSPTPDIDLTISDFYAATDLCLYLNQQPGYSCSMPPQQLWFNPINLADISNASLVTGYTAQADASKYYAYEIAGAKADIENHLPGYQVKTFATPYSSSSDQVEDLIRDAGFQLNRNGMPDNMPTTSYLLSRLNIYNIGSQLTASEFDRSNPKQSVAALVEGLGATGGIFAIYGHGTDEFTVNEWNTLFAELKAIGATCMTASEAVSYVQSHASLVNDGTGKYWDMNISFAPDYHSTAFSPTQGAHLP